MFATVGPSCHGQGHDHPEIHMETYDRVFDLRLGAASEKPPVNQGCIT